MRVGRNQARPQRKDGITATFKDGCFEWDTGRLVENCGSESLNRKHTLRTESCNSVEFEHGLYITGLWPLGGLHKAVVFLPESFIQHKDWHKLIQINTSWLKWVLGDNIRKWIEVGI